MTIQLFRARLRARTVRSLVAVLCTLLLVPADTLVFAQDAPPAQPAAGQAPAAEQQAPKLSNDQLDALVAPIALYPDPLLSQVLVASTYPLDIVQAQQWLGKNSNLKGDDHTKAAQKQDWDPSVQAMVTLPDVVKRMSENVKWTTDLGNAFLAQQDDVMDSVQRLRAKAKQAGKLESSDQQKVETKTVESQTVIVIQPASTQVVYVPTYSPTVIWGPMYYPYPPMYYPPYYAGAAFVSFGVGIAVGAAISGGWGWGCGWGHGNTNITINNNNTFVRNNNINTNNINRSGNTNWQHNAQHRGGVPYQDKATASKYGGGARGDSASTRQAQARQGQSQNLGNRSAGGGASNMSANRGGGGASGSKVGNRDVSPSSRAGGSSAFGGSQSGDRARASSARGSSSMSSHAGGASRGGGGRRR